MNRVSAMGPLSDEEKSLILFAVRETANPGNQPSPAILELWPKINWHRVMLAAARDRALGIVGHILEASGLLKVVPKDVRLALHGAMLSSEAAVTRKKAQLAPILTALDSAGVPAILLKGISLGATIYRGTPYREMSDIDLLVRVEDRAAAEAALASIGFKSVPERNRWQAEFFDASLGRRGLSQPDLGGVDLHWNPSYWTGGRRVRPDLDGFWSRSIPLEDGRAGVRHLAPADDLVFLLLHALEFRGIHLYHLVDLSILLARCGMTEEILDRHLGPDIPTSERARLRGVFRILRDFALTPGPLSELPAASLNLAERFLPDRKDPGLSIGEIFSHARGPMGLSRYFIGHAFPVPAAYPGLGVFDRYRAHVAHYLKQIWRLVQATPPTEN